PPYEAELPLTVHAVSDSVPPSLYRPPPKSALPPVIVSPEIAADPPSISTTWLLPPPSTLSRFAPGPRIVVVAGVFVGGTPYLKVIVCGVVPKTAGSNVMVCGPVRRSAYSIAVRRLFSPLIGSGRSLVVLTTRLSVESRARLSSAVTVGRSCRGLRNGPLS